MADEDGMPPHVPKRLEERFARIFPSSTPGEVPSMMRPQGMPAALREAASQPPGPPAAARFGSLDFEPIYEFGNAAMPLPLRASVEGVFKGAQSDKVLAPPPLPHGIGFSPTLETVVTGGGGSDPPVALSAESLVTKPPVIGAPQLTINEPPRIGSANHIFIVVGLAGLIAQIEDELDALTVERDEANSDERRDRFNAAIVLYEDVKAKAEAALAERRKSIVGQTDEEDLNESASAFATTLNNVWKKFEDLQIVRCGIIVSAAGICHAMGADCNLALAVFGPIVGGQPVVEAIKAVWPKGK